MIRINLLPFRAARKKENIRRQISIFLLTFLFTGAALFYYNGTLNTKIATLENEVQAKKKELATYQKAIKEIQRIRRRLNELKRKTRIINQLNVNRKWPVLFLDSINDMIIEKRMWLTSLRIRNRNISIRGIALDNKTVADFMTRLEQSKLYTNINLKTINQKKIRKYDLKSFDISCQKAQPKPQKKAAAKGKVKK